MYINQTVANEIYREAGPDRLERARVYVKEKRVDIQSIYYEDSNNFSVTAEIEGNYDDYKVKVSVKNGELEQSSCECEDYYKHYAACKHIVATLLEVDGNPKYNTAQYTRKTREKYIDFKDLINTFYEEEMKLIDEPEKVTVKTLDRNIKIIPKFIYNDYTKEMKVEFKIGTKKQLYKIKDITEFYDNMMSKATYRYGAKLEFVHEEESFEEASKPILDFILKHAETIKYINSNANSTYRYFGKVLNASSISLSNTLLDEMFEILKGQEVSIEKSYFTDSILLIDSNPDIKFELEKVNKEEYSLKCNIESHNDYEILQGKNDVYFLTNENLYRCNQEYKNTTLKLLEVFKRNYTTEIKFGKEEISKFFSIVLPKVRQSISLNNLEPEEIEKYMPQKLGVKVFLEFNDKNYIIAKVKFCYGEEEFNPLKENPNIPRSALEEAESLNLFRKTGFMLDKKNAQFILVDDEQIYNFLSEDINSYMQKFEVLATEDFKQKQIKKPKMTALGVKVENNLLSINLENLNFDKKELKEILNQYALKKKYYRLKNGDFLSLEQNEDIDFLENLISGSEISYKELEEGTVKLPMYRTLYLNRIMEKFENTAIYKDENYKRIVEKIEDKSNVEELQIPKSLNQTLRQYQKIGFKWLKTLDEYQFGGILADDMGLGKTIQVLALILAYKESAKQDKKPVMVVCPSSLSLNWKAEIEKFASDIDAIVIGGNATNREQQIKQIPDVDVVITSYDLLKRDIEIYKKCDYEFRYIIADEAQYMKNSNTQNAKAVKELKAKTRFALTGTPIENSLSELWSIFDFLMPGYLFSYRKFKEKFEMPIVRDEDSEMMNKLRMLIEPFILRRTKKEVLTELPDKTITILNNEMEEEQEKLYLSYLAQAKEELQEQIDTQGFEKSQIQILALLTRLRQICCHPSLFLSNYKGESSKLKQCIELVKDTIESGHKILLFSTYTAMFEIIEKELKKENITYFKLTGQTKVNERIDLVDEFNQNPNIKVFLISLKAGGTGLNLTGADMVIHYDPWWNLSAENQATDRAYRIGQKNNVQVYKLITKNSIEEKIYELQEKKAKLIDNVLDTKTSFISKLSKEDIMKLFS
ncbi:MAG: SNF2 helicase associated domain-containing protein [Clostridia bacterium]|nr:SNF2 helicase associated domain-containing protein [Clostridia bacterium]